MDKINGQDLIKIINGAAANLRSHADYVNDLNVFPIPDGDTGENMTLTVNGGVNKVVESSEESIGTVAAQIADGMLLCARGNSGVILSQFFAGVAQGLKGVDEAGVPEVVAALEAGVKSAYAAVLTPTEGTILTVAREASEAAGADVDNATTLSDFADRYLTEMNRSLQHTPELLEALREANVIDSGGAGLYYIVEGAIRAARGEVIADAEGTAPAAPAQTVDLSKFNENSVMEFGYCTEFLLQLQKCKTDVKSFNIDKLVDFLKSIGGESIVAFKTGSIVKCHVHTLTPGKVLDYCQKYGEFLTLKIENMTLQHNESIERDTFAQSEKRKQRKKYGVVAVSTGDGIKATFEDLGADFVVNGGQGNNPSAEDFIKAFDAVNADTVFVLPNNGNIIMAARQAGEMYSLSDVRVIESKSIGDGYAALQMLDLSSDDPDSIVAQMTDAMSDVVCGMVTHAVRDANLNGVEIRENDYIGFEGKTMYSASADKVEAESPNNWWKNNMK